MNVNRSTFYKHFKPKSSLRKEENLQLKKEILTIYSQSKKRFGAYKIRQRLLVQFGKKISVGRVYRLMKSMALPKMSTLKTSHSFINSTLDDYNNILNQKFYPDKPNLVWVNDITYVKVNSRFFYVCVVIDLFARKVIAYKTSSKIDSQLVLDTFYSAYYKRNSPTGIMFHSDRGSQYTSKIFRNTLDSFNFVQSFSAKAHPFDNAVAESFFKYLKKEDLNRKTFSSLDELNLALFEYIEGFYNSKRPHFANKLLTPDEKEKIFFNF